MSAMSAYFYRINKDFFAYAGLCLQEIILNIQKTTSELKELDYILIKNLSSSPKIYLVFKEDPHAKQEALEDCFLHIEEKQLLEQIQLELAELVPFFEVICFKDIPELEDYFLVDSGSKTKQLFVPLSK